MSSGPFRADHSFMSDRGFHRIEAELEDSWLGDWAGAGVALVLGLVFPVPPPLAGLADWLPISPGTPLKRTATSHLLAMVSATVFFLIAALTGHGGYTHGAVDAGPYALTLIGFAAMT